MLVDGLLLGPRFLIFLLLCSPASLGFSTIQSAMYSKASGSNHAATRERQKEFSANGPGGNGGAASVRVILKRIIRQLPRRGQCDVQAQRNGCSSVACRNELDELTHAVMLSLKRREGACLLTVEGQRVLQESQSALHARR